MRFVWIGALAAIFLLNCCGEGGAELKVIYQSICVPALTRGHELFKILLRPSTLQSPSQWQCGFHVRKVKEAVFFFFLHV